MSPSYLNMKWLVPLLMAACFLTSCGRKGPLVPPEALVPPAIADLAAEQKGDQFVVSWGSPPRPARGPVRGATGYALYRREVLPAGEDCEECPNAYLLVKEVGMSYPEGVRMVAGRLYWHDTAIVLGKTYQYKVVALQDGGVASSASNKVRRTVQTPPAPPLVTALSSATGVTLDWRGVPPREKTEIIGYNVYRHRPGEQFSPLPVTATPVPAPPFEDMRLELETPYIFAVRTVARTDGVIVESNLSNEVIAGLVDE